MKDFDFFNRYSVDILERMFLCKSYVASLSFGELLELSAALFISKVFKYLEANDGKNTKS